MNKYDFIKQGNLLYRHTADNDVECRIISTPEKVERLLGCKFKDDADNKASICARTIYDYYIRSNDNRGTQFVFSDLGTYKPNEWNVYTLSLIHI